MKSILAFVQLSAFVHATQVNVYHDSGCGQYAYSVFSSGWSCQDINGVESAWDVNSGAQCNFYSDTNCQDYIRSETTANSCMAQVSSFDPGTGFITFQKWGSVACAE